jgi:excisionase family DNA binding protein
MSSQRKAHEHAAAFRVEGLSGLSRNATRFLSRHPRQARIAVAAALEAAAAQFEAARFEADVRATDADIPEALRPFLSRRAAAADVIGVSEAAARLQVSRTTVYDWIENGRLLGWRSTKRGVSIPAEQIAGPGKVVPGIAEILDIIEDPELAWTFLSQQWPFADDVARPIDRLKAGKLRDVVDAAPGFGAVVT